MNASLRIIAACLGLSLLITYAWWVRVRVWVLRQDLFAIRDDLWDAMRANDQLTNPAYRDLRDGANSLIRLAPFLSVWTIARTILSRDDFRQLLVRDPHIVELDLARLAILRRIVRYLLFESLSGLVILAVTGVFGLSGMVVRRLQQRLGWLIDSKELQTLDQRLSRSGTDSLVHV
jgi:hypothetical protein